MNLSTNYHAIDDRSLYRKRKEMAGLKEETTSLHSQLKAKRRNLHTLEKLLKDANRNKELSHLEEEKSSKKQSTITFMVAFPDGTFIELMEAPETTVRRIITEMKHALLIDNARGNNTADNCISDLNKPFKLFFKGKLLYNDATMDQCGLRNGDTILFAPDHKAAPEPTPQVVRKEVIMQESQSPNIDGVMDVIREQMECMKKLTDEVK